MSNQEYCEMSSNGVETLADAQRYKINDGNNSDEPHFIYSAVKNTFDEEELPICLIQNVNVRRSSEIVRYGTRIYLPTSENNSTEYNEVEINGNGENNEGKTIEDNYTLIGDFNTVPDSIEDKGDLGLSKYLLVFMAFLLLQITIYVFLSLIYPSQTNGINSNEIEDLNINTIGENLTNYISRRDDWGTDPQCSVECPVKRKSKIKLVIPKSLLFTCSIVRGFDCKDEFQAEYKFYRTSHKPFNDVYYNYIIGVQGYIYEARPFTCSYDERILLGDDHSETLVIGISYCFPDRSNANELKTRNELRAIRTILTRLKGNGILSDHLEFELLQVCKNSLIARQIKEENYPVKFYDTDYNDVSSKMNPDIANGLTFNSYGSSSKALTHLLKNTNIIKIAPCNNISLAPSASKNITVRLLFAEQLNIPFSNDCTKYSDCERFANSIIKTQKDAMIRFDINYFAFMSEHALIFEIYPLNCSLKSDKEEIVIGVLLFLPPFPSYKEPELYFQSLSKLLMPITTRIRGYIDINRVDIEFLCDKEVVSDTDSLMIYEFISNVYYLYYRESGNIIRKSKCAISPAFILNAQNAE